MPAEPDARPAEVARLVDPGRDQHRVVRARGSRRSSMSSPTLQFEPERHAAGLELVVAAHHHVLLELEARDAVDQQPAGPVVAVVDRHLDARAAAACPPPRGPPGPAPMMPTLSGRSATRPDRLHPALLPGGVGDVLLDRADRHRAVARLLDDAVALAEPVLRADAAADLGEGVGRLAELVGLAQPPLGGQLQPVGDVVVQRAMGLAVRHAALRAAARLLGRLLRRELAVDLAEVLAPLAPRRAWPACRAATVTNFSILFTAMPILSPPSGSRTACAHDPPLRISLPRRAE